MISGSPGVSSQRLGGSPENFGGRKSKKSIEIRRGGLDKAMNSPITGVAAWRRGTGEVCPDEEAGGCSGKVIIHFQIHHFEKSYRI
ncbi:MAG: hypothetical protein LBD55_05095 [Treponema sp.]|jgi:hypothetical protein|nr:hypothetical protein [Treponema sp.]